MNQQLIVLLDLNFTLVANSRDTFHIQRGPDVSAETYRQWLVDLLRPCYVVMITSRTDDFQQKTLASIRHKTGWLPQAYHFKPVANRYMKAPQFKGYVLMERVLPAYGDDPAQYLALESNAATRAMYASHGIKAVPVPKVGQWRSLEEALMPAKPKAGALDHWTQLLLI